MRIIVVALRGESLRHVEVQFSKIKEAWSIARGGASGLRGLQRASTARRSGSRQWRIARLCTVKLREMFPRPAAAFGTAMPSSGSRLSDS
jgi:hypothetical protein